jgi:phosphoribosylanthranilate isomerase
MALTGRARNRSRKKNAALGPENIAAAIAAVRPAGVDSKTGTDRTDGMGKDLDRVRAFVAAARLTR